MASMAGRVRKSARSVVAAGIPNLLYFGVYEMRVVKQSADLTKVDVEPVDTKLKKRIPGMTVKVRHGLPGVTVQVQAGARLLVGWIGADPSQPYVHSWAGEENVDKVVLKSTLVYGGDEAGAEPLARKSDVDNHVHAAGTIACSNGTISGSTAGMVPITGTSRLKGK